MSMIKDLQELGLIIDVQVGDVLKEAKDQIDNASKHWLVSKRQTYSDAAYIEQLEKNSVYFGEATGSSIFAIAQFIHSGEPKLTSQEKISEYVTYVGRTRVITKVNEPIIAYVRGYEASIPLQLSQIDWSRIRHLRASRDIKAYTSELEFLCRIYNAGTSFADIYLSYILTIPQMSAAGKSFEFYEAVGVVFQRINWWTNWCVGNIRIQVGNEFHLANDEFAGTRYDAKRIVENKKTLRPR